MKRIFFLFSILLCSLTMTAQSAWLFNRGDSISWQPSQDMTVTFEKDPAGFFWQNIQTNNLDVVRMPIKTGDGIKFADTPFLQVEKKYIEANNIENHRFEIRLKTNISTSEYTWSFNSRHLQPISANTEPSIASFVFEYDPNGIGSYSEIVFFSDKYNLRDTVRVGIETAKAREVLMDFYQATDGGHWKNNTNWGSDKPLNEWYGLEYVYDGSFWGIHLYDNNLTGILPKSLKYLSSIYNLYLDNNNLTGTIPEELVEMSNLHVVDITRNHFSGEFPEKPFSEWMKRAKNRFNFCFFENDFTAPIPDWAQRHELFSEFWPEFCIQNGMDFKTIANSIYKPGPDYKLTDLEGNIHKSNEDYPNNKLTILYHWATWCPYSQSFTPKLSAAYNKYKNAGLKVLGMDDFGSQPHDTQEELESYCAEHHVTWPNISLGYDYENDRYNIVWPMTIVTETPLIFAVDSKGELVFQSIGGCYDDFIPLLEKMFGPIDDTEYYTSTDYSQDGKVTKLQTATEGEGIDLVFMGEAFVDKDMESGGKYEQKMNEAMEQFFSIEPYTSLRSHFNVYAVKAVSPNAEFASDAKHAINESNEKAFEYAKKALGGDAKRMMVGVIYNTGVSIDRSNTTMYEGDGSFVAYMMDGVSNVLNHEMGGHGIAFLLDEYVEKGMEDQSPNEEAKAALDAVFANYGEGANVDWRNDPSEVKWAHFLKDSRYADEGLGVYEGGWLYGHGVYRPTLNSMMRHNDCGFNAPSREAIYKRVMKLSEGDSWTYDYDKFVEFDTPARESYRKQQSAARRAQGQNVKKRLIESRPPTIYKGTWRDAGKCEKVDYSDFNK